MNRLDRAILALAPGWAAGRARARCRVQAYSSAYEATKPGRRRAGIHDFGSGNTAAAGAIKPLRDIARQLERNHDLSRGAIGVLVRNIVGPTGIGIEPQPKNSDGSINAPLARQLHDLWMEWSERPEVTRELDWPHAQQLLCRSWVRDGEALYQMLAGTVKFLTHYGSVPFSIELLEADMLPLDLDDPSKGILQGVERNAWGKPIAYHLYKEHPGDPMAGMHPGTKRVSADVIRMIKLSDRIGQVRGVSIFASVLDRLDDLKDYEESERIAAKVAASLAAAITKGEGSDYQPPTLPDGTPAPRREMSLQAGMIFDDLAPGETIETIDSKRPNPGAVTWRDGQLRAAAAGLDASYSSVSKNYNGTYSAQRQELVEQYSAYGVLSRAFTSMAVRPAYQQFVSTAMLAGTVRIPIGVTARQMSAALYSMPIMPWIDPIKEATALEKMEGNVFESAPEIIRRRGRNPAEVIESERAWREQLAAAGLTSLAAAPATPSPKPGAS